MVDKTTNSRNPQRNTPRGSLNAAGSDETEAPNPPAPGAQRHEQPNKRRSREKRLGGRDENGTDRYLRVAVAAVAKEGGTAYRRLPRAWGCVGEEATGLDTRLDWRLEPGGWRMLICWWLLQSLLSLCLFLGRVVIRLEDDGDVQRMEIGERARKTRRAGKSPGQRRLLLEKKNTEAKGKCDSKHAVLLQSYTYDLHV